MVTGDREISTLDLFQRGWVLLSEGGCWAESATRAATELGLDVAFVHIGVDAKPGQPQAFRDAYGFGARGATLVRPDGYIAWRAVTAPADLTRELAIALARTSAAATRPAGA